MFNDPQASKADLISAGEDARMALYKGRPGGKLDLLDCMSFIRRSLLVNLL